MDFTILEARTFKSTYGKLITRVVKDYEIDMERKSGRLYRYDGISEQRLSFGDILVRTPHHVVSTSGAQNSYILTLDFSGATRTESYSRNVPGTFQPLFKNEAIVRMEPIIHPARVNDISQIYQRLVTLPNRNSIIAKELVHELIYLLNAEIAKKNYEVHQTAHTIAETIFVYMQEHLDQPITLGTLSDFVHLEKSYLLRRFRIETGKTPIEALIEMRLDKACDLIAATDLSINEIAAACGYHTVSFFIATYKKRYGMTPQAHRRMLRAH